MKTNKNLYCFFSVPECGDNSQHCGSTWKQYAMVVPWRGTMCQYLDAVYCGSIWAQYAVVVPGRGTMWSSTWARYDVVVPGRGTTW